MRALREGVLAHLRDPLYRDAWFLMGNAGLGAVTGFLFWLVAARVATPQEVGSAAALVSAFTLAALLGKFGFDAILIRHVPTLAPGTRRKLLTRTLLVAVLGTACIAAAFAALAHASPFFPPVSGSGAALFVAFAAAIAAAWVFDAWFIAERRADRAFLRNAVFNVGRLALVAAPFLGLRSIPLALAWGGAAALSLVVAAFLPRRGAASGPLPSVAGTGLANYVVGVGEFLPGLVFPILVVAFLGEGSNAAFYVAWTLASVPFLASKAIAQSTFAELSGGDRRTALRRGAKLHALVLVPAALLGVAAGPYVLGVFGPHYVAAAPLLVVLSIALVPAAANNLAFAALKADDRRFALVALSVVLLVLTVGGGVALMPALGVVAPGVAWLAANVVVLPWTLPLVLASGEVMRAAGRVGRAPHEG